MRLEVYAASTGEGSRVLIDGTDVSNRTVRAAIAVEVGEQTRVAVSLDMYEEVAPGRLRLPLVTHDLVPDELVVETPGE